MVRGCLAALCLLLAALAPAFSEPTLGEEQARQTARNIGRALESGDLSRLQSSLPKNGKVQLRLVVLGPEQGAYGAGQVQAVLKDFLRQGKVRSFELKRLDCASGKYALVHARLAIDDRNGRPAEVDLRMTLQPEAGRWVLQEIRETRP